MIPSGIPILASTAVIWICCVSDSLVATFETVSRSVVVVFVSISCVCSLLCPHRLVSVILAACSVVSFRWHVLQLYKTVCGDWTFNRAYRYGTVSMSSYQC